MSQLQQAFGYHIDEEHAPISKPIAHLIGNTTSYADTTKTGYTLPIQVKSYLSKISSNRTQ